MEGDPQPEPAALAVGRPVLEIQGLRKAYGNVSVLRGLEMCVREGEVYGFLGRNGAGKSTTIRIVMGITKANAGTVRLFGEPLDRGLVRLRQRIGYVAQEQNFYGWMTPTTLGSFVSAFYPTWDDSEFTRLVRVLDLPPKRRVRTFSGGMRVKLGLALALAHRPRLLVLDEPMAGLDPVARREFLEMICDQAEESGRTTFFSTHLIDEIELAAHRVGVVEDGILRYEGTIQELAARVRLLRQPTTGDGTGLMLPTAVVDPQGGLTVMQDRTRKGERTLVLEADDPARFDALAADPAGWTLEVMSLEDIFVEMVRKPLKQS